MDSAPDGNLRIALVVPPYFDIPPRAYGGVEAVVADLANALVEHGHQVTMIGAGTNGTKADFLAVWPEAVAGRLGEAFPEIAHTSLARQAVAELHATDGLDVVHDHTGGGPLNAPFFATLGLATVVTVHGPVNGDLGLLYKSLRDHIQLVAISHRQRELAPGLPWIGTVHNALSIHDWPYQERKEDYALFLGRFHQDKGAHLALDAAHAAGIPLVLAGKCAEPVEKEYFDREIQPRMTSSDHFYGMANAEEKRILLAAAKCLLFPIQWEEPFGMVLIEAMACGTPVIALRGGAVSEIVGHGETGLICDHPHELAEAIRQVHQINPAACRRRVTLRFNADRLASGYENAYRAAMAQTLAKKPGLSALAMQQ
ncbi:glycosyltransferase family 4 protein [Catelliglobosispora koreensis]|uniref:glycosyltransferase family 4 protein n=1 Tax=Catelliglobosispora koreensis TaxID=129052 RepID=UPI00037A7EBF|nr:glycosyltransferase family 4 protein [Catelliglobosispora koreensis]